ncbi:DUF4145 domain-containing protein [Helicobacter sp. MIT 21-1697]|uniref:DUF4145 domain-containing protein n=1 Tax=Helicobacter sp. MIT 21-1697 TaxID=2993733 RepID=UPI00224A4AF1|nr:DUF4145 domain-containing protein [Helicobacter sp. MIT 21-1697]MCX2717799.1 DUF4145 domain-containing protein [Helicobacter sp. MIT 21-1697]
MHNYEIPSIDKKAFTCPHCNVLAQMEWKNLHSGTTYDLGYSICIAVCQVCYEYSLWQKYGFLQKDKPQLVAEMLYPKQTAIPPAEDMPQSIKALYIEASGVLGDSPRAACALLRLALEELMVYLRDNFAEYKSLKGKNINEDIKELVKLGLPAKVQKALDIVRITGNNAVHSMKELDINDNPQIAYKLFEILNFIIREMITRPKELDSIFEDNISEGEKAAIKRRDGK